jgi:hypothetical protein
MVYGQASPPTIDCLKCFNHRVSQSAAQSNTEFLGVPAFASQVDLSTIALWSGVPANQPVVLPEML